MSLTWLWSRIKNTVKYRTDQTNFKIPSTLELTNDLRRSPVSSRTTNRLNPNETPYNEEHSFTTTCNACKVTIHHHQTPAPRLKEACPFCGQPYSNSTINDCGRRFRVQRLGSDSSISHFRLPIINGPCLDTSHTRYERFGYFMVRQLGGNNLSNFENYTLRSTFDLSLPKIVQDPESRLLGGSSPSEFSPDMESTRVKSSLSIDTYGSSEPEDSKPIPNYPIRNKTREDFLTGSRNEASVETLRGRMFLLKRKKK